MSWVGVGVPVPSARKGGSGKGWTVKRYSFHNKQRSRKRAERWPRHADAFIPQYVYDIYMYIYIYIYICT